MIHQLKCEKVFFEEIITQKKRFEVRKNDRGFSVGDYLALNEYDAENELHTGRSVFLEVTSLIDDERFCKPGFVIMSIEICGIESDGQLIYFLE